MKINGISRIEKTNPTLLNSYDCRNPSDPFHKQLGESINQLKEQEIHGQDLANEIKDSRDKLECVTGISPNAVMLSMDNLAKIHAWIPSFGSYMAVNTHNADILSVIGLKVIKVYGKGIVQACIISEDER